MAASYPPQQVPVTSVPSTRVELHLSCKKLKDMDLLSKSDPIVSVLVKDAKSGSWKEVRVCILVLYISGYHRQFSSVHSSVRLFCFHDLQGKDQFCYDCIDCSGDTNLRQGCMTNLICIPCAEVAMT